MVAPGAFSIKPRVEEYRFAWIQSASVCSIQRLLAAATPPAVRQLAARDIIELGDRLREVSDLEPRLCNLEEQLAKNGGRDGKASA